jgi:signal transduction histidine kinase
VTSTEPPVGRTSRLALRNWSLPVKLGAVLAVPIILAMTLGVLGVNTQIRNATDLGARDRYIALQDKVATLITQLQRERDQSAVFVAGNRTGDRSVLKSVFGAVDGGLADTETAIGNPATLGGGPETAYRRVKDNLSRLIALRDQVTTFGVDPPAVVARYTGLIEPLLVFESSLDRQLNTPALAGMSGGLTALNNAREQIALQHAVIAVAVARGEMQPADADTVRATDARLGTAIDQFRAGLDGDQQERYAGWTTSQADTQRQRIKQAALSRIGARGQLGISQADWDGTYDTVLDEMRNAENGLRQEIKATSYQQQDKARDAAGVTSVILLLGLIATGAVVYLVGRSLLTPLRVLRKTALDVADRRLPEAVAAMREGKTPDVAVEPVPVTSREEIGQVARAFDAVHGQAVRLAAEQATLQSGVSSMFINLSRRSQGLVERQLRLIEQLERNEQDSEQLANLFQLDHLATRMRRNSENLLVLAGSDVAKRANQTVPVVDVLRAAVSEIEQYQRVVVQTPPDVQVMGRAASDLVHLVAELLENATAFSAPDTQVVVSSTRTPDGSVLVEIADQGVGMPGEELIAANNRLSGPAEVNVSASRRMGLFVVGRLAARHGIGVRLASSDPGRGATLGVTASVNVPSYLVSGALTSGTDTPDGGRPARPDGVNGRAGAGIGSGKAPNGTANGTAKFGGTAAFAPIAAAGAAGAAAAAGAAVANGRAGADRPAGTPPKRKSVGDLPSRKSGADLPGPKSVGDLPSRTPGADLAGPKSGGDLPSRTPGADLAGRKPAGDLPSRTPGADLAGRKPGDDLPSRTSGDLPSRTPGGELGGRKSGSELPTRTPGAAAPELPTRGMPPMGKPGAAANGTAPADSRPGTSADAPPARRPGAPGDAAATSGGTPAAGGPPGSIDASAGLPRRAAGASLAGPLSRTDSPTGQSPPLMPRRDSADPGDGRPGRPSGPRPGALRSPTGLSSLRTPPRGPQERGPRDADGGRDRMGPAGPGRRGPQGPPMRPGGPVHNSQPMPPASMAPPPASMAPPPPTSAPAQPPIDFAAPTESQPRRALAEPRTPSDSRPMPEVRPLSDPRTPSDSRPLPEVRPLSDSRPLPPVPPRDPAPPVDASAAPDAPPLDFSGPVHGSGSLPPVPFTSENGADRSGSQALSAPAVPYDPSAESPIFAEMASAWFRDDRETAQGPGRLVKGPEVPAPPLPPDGWGEDDGWSTGEPLLTPFVEEQSSELTTAGLPKRQRGSRLIPGGAHAANAGNPESPATPAATPRNRTPEQIRGRLASYQQGVQQGRAARHRKPDPAAVPETNGQDIIEEAQ